MIAGGMTKSNKIGMVGGFPIPEVNRLMNAFMAGAKETNPKVEFSVSFINSWFDPPKAKEAAFAMIDKGADVMYAERFGVSDAAKEKGKLAIGNVINTQDKYPDTVVASALWNMEPSIDRALKLVKDGKFTAEDYGQYSMMKYKGSELAPLGTFEKKVPADLVAKVKAKEKAILDGKFTVKVDDTSPSRRPTEPAAAAAGAGAAPAGITKRFGALVANDDISLELHAGEVLALLGENGAGKSHAGVDPVRPLRGRRRAASRSFGRPLPPGHPRAALAAGIGMVHQHFTLADNLTVLDNVMLGTRAAVAAFLAPRRRARASCRRGAALRPAVRARRARRQPVGR